MMRIKLGAIIILFIAGTISRLSADGVGQENIHLSDTTEIRHFIQLTHDYDTNFEYDSSRYYATQSLLWSGRLLQSEIAKSSQDLLNKIRILKIQSYVAFAMAFKGQNIQAAEDSLMAALKLCGETGDTKEKAAIFGEFGRVYEHKGKNEKALQNIKKALEIYQKIGDQQHYTDELINLGILLRGMGKYGESLENLMESLKIGRELSDSTTIVESLLGMGFVYAFVEKWDDALRCQREALEIYEQLNDSWGIARIHNDMGVTYMSAGKLDSALTQHHAALDIRLKSNDTYNTFASYLYIGDILAEKGNLAEAIEYYENGIPYGEKAAYKITVVDAHVRLGDYYLVFPNFDKAIHHFKTALQLNKEVGDPTSESSATMGLAKIYLKKNEPGKVLPLLKRAEKAAPGAVLRFRKNIYKDIADIYFRLGDFENAYINSIKYSVVKDSAITAESLEKITRLTNKLEFENAVALKKESNEKMLAIKQAQINRERLARNIFLFGMILAVGLVIIIFIRFVEKKKLNSRLNETLRSLQDTQTQLVHAEKMASLGELTAGIAHEIKNPLNFVNNFSEVSQELLDEMKDEWHNKNEVEVMKLIDNIKLNLHKINQHGKRADAIVKGMLLHSKGSSSEKTPTDINNLLDQYVNLAYHGMRAQNKEFNIAIEKDFDETLKKINLVPQDMGRVFLNLINNACYAAYDNVEDSGSNFSPTLKVSTKNHNEKVEIKISDNGNGIPMEVSDKIFQPFFTTKPTGEGTGLGLSLSYDIVVKQHGGKIKFDTKEGEFTEFIITLPKD